MTASALLRTVRAYVVLTHPVPILLVLVATATFAALAAAGRPAPGDLARLLLAMLGGQVAIGAVNDVVDADVDTLVKPAKPITAGHVSVRGALILAAVGLVVMAVGSASLGVASLLVCALGTAVGLAYSFWFKRTLLAWLPSVIALPLLPIWVSIAMTEFDARLLLLYPLGALAAMAVHLSHALPDVAADVFSGVRNLTSMLGERRAILLCWTAVLVSIFALILAATWLAAAPRFAWGAGALATLTLAFHVAAYRWRPSFGVPACFPCVAVSVGLLGLGWVLAVSR